MNARLVNSAAGVVNAALTQNRTAAGIAMALESAGLLMGPETAAELARLRQYAEDKQSREEELLATLGQYNLVASPDAWALGMTVISHLEGPHTPSSPEELEPGHRKLIEQLRARAAELEAQRAALAVRLRAGQRWRRGRSMPLISQDFVSQDELRDIFGIQLTAPWDAPAEDPCHPCGCPKRFDQHADGCPTLATPGGVA